MVLLFVVFSAEVNPNMIAISKVTFLRLEEFLRSMEDVNVAAVTVSCQLIGVDWLGRSRQRKIKVFFSHKVILYTQVSENMNHSSHIGFSSHFLSADWPHFWYKGTKFQMKSFPEGVYTKTLLQ